MNYETMRIFADSWGLAYLFVVFIAVLAYTFRPGSADEARHKAEIPFKEDE